MEQHLWEVNHDYYCADSNYYAPGNAQPGQHFKSIADFLKEEADADLDYNLLFRWDWQELHEETGEPNYNGDPYYRNGKLFLFFMGQRKGLYRWATVDVCRADEPAVIEYLKPRLEHLRKLWSPLSL